MLLVFLFSKCECFPGKGRKVGGEVKMCQKLQVKVFLTLQFQLKEELSDFLGEKKKSLLWDPPGFCDILSKSLRNIYVTFWTQNWCY